MDVSQIGLFALAERRLSWLERKQDVLAGNVANADTPGWRPREIAPFSADLARAGAALATTRPNHLQGAPGAARGQDTEPKPAARAPDGNAVSLDEQLMKVADVESTQEMVTNLYTKYLGFFRLALGHGQ